MGRTSNPDVAKVLNAWFNGAELRQAWVDAGKPVTWDHLLNRVAKPRLAERQQHLEATARQRQQRRDAAEDDAEQPPAPSNTRKLRAAPDTQEKAPVAAAPAGSVRTGPIQPKQIRRTSAQVAKQLDVDQAYRDEYERVHKAAQADGRGRRRRQGEGCGQGRVPGDRGRAVARMSAEERAAMRAALDAAGA